MSVLVTGATGFVMSAFVRGLLEAQPRTRVIALDAAPPTDLHAAYYGDLAQRITHVVADVCDVDAVRVALEPDVDLVVHGATVTHSPAAELASPGRYLTVNVGGTAAVLDAVRSAPAPPRFVYLSSGAVYGGTPAASPRHEDGPCRPEELYGISKLSAESVVCRYHTLFGIDAVVVRPAKVFGTMERPTGGRALTSVPHLLAGAAVGGEPLTVTRRTLDAAGDWIDVRDVSRALLALSDVPADATAYNIGSGMRTPFAELVAVAERWSGKPAVEVVDEEVAALDLDPALRLGKDDAYAVDRLRAATGWRPRPVADRFATYLDWAAEHPAVFQTNVPNF